MDTYQYIINKPFDVEITERHGHWEWHVEVGSMKNKGRTLTELDAWKAALRAINILQYYDQPPLPHFNVRY